ncbi:UNVERIFIED_CONTAM: COBRA-like protein 4 [Sesamum angustifolium]|uniref:COBRA-like protein 4 n=1 Tax=Sesamum angustifolium TaxID=2727405 RepID=A0AAW2QAJ4_9LAMI
MNKGVKFSMWAVLLFVIFSQAESYDPLDPFGNITIKWDVVSWTPDGYVAVVTMNNFQMYRHIMSPGWTLSWGWAKKEVIWSMVGAQTTEQGDCSKFKGNVPHCCKRNPTVVDLLPECLTISRLTEGRLQCRPSLLQEESHSC